ncbi:MAG: hypothetical protein ATN35_00150 [Epulopiscium sp. Nele67-Bin004]|nr:MAG: hypothetical protein ATN35_00150 [Epulopiscium sp. Nele67-Bin004]
MEEKQEVKVAEKPAEHQGFKPVVDISVDKMMATVMFKPFTSTEEIGVVVKSDIDALLEEQEIVYGIDEDAIYDALDKMAPNVRYTIARGTKPTQGEEAKLKYITDEQNKGVPDIDDDGKVDFKNLHLIVCVQQNEVVVTKTPATLGEVGTNILGEEIPAIWGKDTRLPPGKNVITLPDELTMIAGVDGQVVTDNGKIEVKQVLTLKEVGPATGNIDFIGSVIIEGGIKEGYSVKAGGDIDIRGAVEAANIESGGSIVIALGVKGKDKAVLKAQKTVMSKFIEHSEVTAGEDVLTEAILHSRVYCRGSVRVDKGKGLIIGGEVVAYKSVYLNKLGSAMGVPTNVRIGVTQAIIDSYQEVIAEYKQATTNLDNANKAIKFLESKKSYLPKDKLELLDKTYDLKQALNREILMIQNKMQKIKVVIKNGSNGVIVVNENIYNGTTLIIGDKTRKITKDRGRVKFFIHDNEIQIGVV